MFYKFFRVPKKLEKLQWDSHKRKAKFQVFFKNLVILDKNIVLSRFVRCLTWLDFSFLTSHISIFQQILISKGFNCSSWFFLQIFKDGGFDCFMFWIFGKIYVFKVIVWKFSVNHNGMRIKKTSIEVSPLQSSLKFDVYKNNSSGCG